MAGASRRSIVSAARGGFVRRAGAAALAVSLAAGAALAETDPATGAGGAEKRPTLAVLDFPMDEVHLHGVGGDRARPGGGAGEAAIDLDFDLVENLQDGFLAKIEEILTQGRRFDVLDRTRPEVYEAEKRILRSEDAGDGERARLGQVLGADYLLFGEIDRISVEDRTRTIEVSGERYEGLAASAAVRFTALETATRRVAWSSALARDAMAPPGLSPERAAKAALDEVAAAVAREFTETLYPPRIAEVFDPRRFAINRGGATVSEGDLFEVFAEGDWLIDPDTGERLDRLEISAGVARVVAVKSKHSIAELISEGADIATGMVLRRRRVDSDAAEFGLPAAGPPGFRDDDGDGLPDYLNRL